MIERSVIHVVNNYGVVCNLVLFFPGADLPFCSRTDAQCCSVGFLDRVENLVLETLGTDLREEYKNVIIAYHEEIEELIDCESKIFI